GLLGTGAALLMIRAKSVLEIWWQISGIFGGALLGLFLLAFMRVRLRLWQGIASIGVSITVISWGTFARDLSSSWQWAQCNLDPIIVGAVGTAALCAVACLFGLTNRNRDIQA
ncbi:MAG: sodium:solute symporter, partial [Planctomycetes bacterium]|nr:sodium:solute symporter [Planctomycetota bacterium]